MGHIINWCCRSASESLNFVSPLSDSDGHFHSELHLVAMSIWSSLIRTPPAILCLSWLFRQIQASCFVEHPPVWMFLMFLRDQIQLHTCGRAARELLCVLKRMYCFVPWFIKLTWTSGSSGDVTELRYGCSPFKLQQLRGRCQQKGKVL